MTDERAQDYLDIAAVHSPPEEQPSRHSWWPDAHRVDVGISGRGFVPFNYRPDVPDDAIVIKEIFDENVYEMSESRLNGGWVVDIGANIGGFTYLCRRYGAHKTISVEPDNDNLEVLESNIRMAPGDLTTALVFHGALWHEDTYGLRLDGEPGGGKQVSYDSTEGFGLGVRGWTLHNILSECKGEIIDVLKIDCEGGEYNIRPNDVALLSSVGFLCMEYHGTELFGTTAEQFGSLVGILSEAFNLHIFGNWKGHGGMILGTAL